MTVKADAARLLKAADPGNADSIFRAGAKAVKIGLAAEALPLLKAGAANHPDDARIWQVLGLAYRKLEDLALAVEALVRAAALAPADPLIAHTHARAALEAGLPAADLFERAHRIAPTDGQVILGRAAALLAEGRIDDAIAGLDDQLRQHPGWLPGHGSATRLRWLNGEQADFTSSFERALAQAPGEIPIWREWADTLMHAGLYDEALAVVARGRAAAGAHIVFDALETVCVAEQGDIAEADRLFAALGPIAHVTMAIRYVRHLLRAGRPAEAVAFAEPWLQDEGADLLWPYMAAAWRLTGDPRWQWLEGDPSFVGVYDLGGAMSLEALADVLRGLHLALHQPLEQSVRGGTQTDGPLFSRVEPEIRALRAAIVDAVETHVAQLPPFEAGHPLLGYPRASPVRFSGSWSVRLAGGGRHANHIHPAGWLSSAFYVALPEAAAQDDPHAGWLTLGEPQAELGVELPPFRTIEPKPGRLVLFPSTMWHGTRPFAEGERLTVAFDVARPIE